MKTPTFGIDALALALPRRYVSLEDLARGRGVDPAKYLHGLGVREMAVPDPGEDTVALAATATARLLETSALDPSKMGMLIVGTETGVDHAKAVASFVQGALGLPGGMRTYDVQHACYGATAALMTASEWLASGAAAGRYAVVVAADVARYGLRSLGEPTQGAGAVAMAVTESPRVLALDFGVSGVASSDVHDFWRPIGHREPLVDGHYSIDCYLDTLAGAFSAWRAKAASCGILGDSRARATEALARFAYHVPFCKMARKAHARLRRVDLEAALGAPPDAAAIEREDLGFPSRFEDEVGSSLSLCARVGNAYTASLYIGLAGMLSTEGDSLVGKRIGLFSYGSGCCGEFFSGVVGEGATRARASLGDPAAVLAKRTRIDFAEYERLMSLAPTEPEPAGAAGVRFVGVKDGKRQYARTP